MVKATLSGILKSNNTIVHLQNLGMLFDWTIIMVGLRCIFQIIFETVYQHIKTKPLKNDTIRSCKKLWLLDLLFNVHQFR